jgi:hypothetical protein
MKDLFWGIVYAVQIGIGFLIAVIAWPLYVLIRFLIWKPLNRVFRHSEG